MKQNKYKKQHFYSRCLLKHWSEDGIRIRVWRWNKGKKKKFKDSLRKVGQKRWLYTEDQERRFSNFESEFSPIIDGIVKNNRLCSSDERMLRDLMDKQCYRTLDSKEVLEWIHSLMEREFGQVEVSGEDVWKYLIDKKLDSQGVVSDLENSLIDMTDLRMVLVNNRSREEFVTSDVPVLSYSKLIGFRTLHYLSFLVFQNRGILRAFKGPYLRLRGVMVFFSISPRHLLLLYDSDAYSLRGVNGDENSIWIDNDYDVRYVNALHLNSIMIESPDNNKLYYKKEDFNIESVKEVCGRVECFSRPLIQLIRSSEVGYRGEFGSTPSFWKNGLLVPLSVMLDLDNDILVDSSVMSFLEVKTEAKKYQKQIITDFFNIDEFQMEWLLRER